jgi:hypothetical protein
VQPDTVASGDTFHVTVTITNPTADTVTLVSGNSCVVLPIIEREGEVQHFDGTGLFCLDVISRFPIAPGDSLLRDFEVVALLMEGQAPFEYVIAPPTGEYTVRADMNVGLPDMEALLVVAPQAQPLSDLRSGR